MENEVVLELKSLETVLPLHEAQLLTYLRLTGKQIGLLINFNVPLLKKGIYRPILGTTVAGYQGKICKTQRRQRLRVR